MEVFARHTHHMPAWGCSRFSRTTGHCLPAMSTARSSTCRSQTSQQASGSSSDACSEGYKASRRACIYSAAAAVLLQGMLVPERTLQGSQNVNLQLQEQSVFNRLLAALLNTLV